MSLDPTHSAEEVAEALGETEHYVLTRCRAGEWPHLRGARNRPRFTAEQYAQILALLSAEPSARPEPRISFAPRSRRTA